jgi:protein CpxP
MKRFMLAGIALQLSVLPALAQNTTTSPSRAPTPAADPSTPMTGAGRDTTSTKPAAGAAMRPDQSTSSAQVGAAPGANSFTEAQARARLEKNGFTQVSGLAKGNDGIWRGSAMKNGGPVRVSVDYKGNVATN